MNKEVMNIHPGEILLEDFLKPLELSEGIQNAGSYFDSFFYPVIIFKIKLLF